VGKFRISVGKNAPSIKGRKIN